MSSLARDLRFAVRFFARSPILTIATVFSLALGIGLTTAVFSLVDTLLLRPVPGVRDPQEIVVIYETVENGPAYLPVSFPDFQDFGGRNRSFESLVAHQLVRADASIRGETHQIIAELVSPDFFSTLGIEIEAGRSFQATSQAEQGTEVILSHRFWRRQFAADPKILGQAIRLNGGMFTIIGVVGEAFRGTNAVAAVDLWAPLEVYRTLSPQSDLYDSREGQILQVTGRLKAGVTLLDAQAEMKAIATHLERDYPASNRGRSVSLMSLGQATVHPNRRPFLVKASGLLMAMLALLLLVTCGNVANLLLARAAMRGREVAVRVALGANRFRLCRQFLAESLLLAILGGAAGALVARWASLQLWRLRPPIFEASGLVPVFDWRAVIFLAIVSALVGLCCGVFPVLQLFRQDFSFSSVAHSKQRAVGRKGLAGKLLVMFQVAFSCVILTCAGLLLKHLASIRQLDPGFETERLLTGSYDLRSLGYDQAEGQRFHQRVRMGLAALPGAESVALAEVPVSGGFRMSRLVRPVGAPVDEGMLLGSIAVDEYYFRTVGIPILRGRGFEGSERPEGDAVTVINETMAHQLWPGLDPVGKKLHLDNERGIVEVVGVARNARHLDLTQDPEPLLYLPLSQRYNSGITIHVRSAGPPEPLLEPVRREIRALSPDVSLIDCRPIAASITRSFWMQSLSFGAMSLLGFLALGLASVGLYGVMSYFVSARSREVGIRLALGARPAAIASNILLEGGQVVGVGIVLGSVPAILVGRWMNGLLRDGSGAEILICLAASLLILSTGVLANAVPAFRATRVDPMISLQAE